MHPVRVTALACEHLSSFATPTFRLTFTLLHGLTFTSQYISYYRNSPYVASEGKQTAHHTGPQTAPRLQPTLTSLTSSHRHFSLRDVTSLRQST